MGSGDTGNAECFLLLLVIEKTETEYRCDAASLVKTGSNGSILPNKVICVNPHGFAVNYCNRFSRRMLLGFAAQGDKRPPILTNREGLPPASVHHVDRFSNLR